MKVEVEMPDGKYCGDCPFLGMTMSTYETDSEYDCNYTFGILTFDDGDWSRGNPIKHSNCPNKMED